MPLSPEKRRANAEISEEIRRIRLEWRFQFGVSQAGRLLRALNEAPRAPATARYMAAVFQHHLRDFADYRSRYYQQWNIEVRPFGVQLGAYYRIEHENLRMRIACQGSDQVEVNCSVEIAGENSELIVLEERRPSGKLEVLPLRNRVSLLATITSDFVEWCRSKPLQVNINDHNAPPAPQTHFVIESRT